MKPLRIFISSVQKEFSAERIVLRDWLRNDALMHRFFEPFLFEDGYALFKLTTLDALRMASNLSPSLFHASRLSSA